MINYIRSEFYRILHTKEIYLFNLLLTAGVLALNGGIHAAAATLPNIRYANVKCLAYLFEHIQIKIM